MENPLSRNEKSAGYKWKIRTVEMKNPYSKNLKSAH
jgi:hypothetical protein